MDGRPIAIDTPSARPAPAVGGPLSGVAAALREAAGRLFARFQEFHSYGPPRLKYMGWVGVAGYVSFYFIRFTRSNYDPDEDLALRAVVLILFLGTALQGLWPDRQRRVYFAWAYLTLLVGLPFFAVYTGLERGGGVPAVSNCFVALGFLVLLVDWRNLIAMLLLGTGAAYLAFRVGDPGAPVPVEMLAQLPAYLLITVGGYVFKYSTEQVEQDRKLQEQRLADERRLAALGDALGFMAHELNTPLATIRTAVSVLRDRVPAYAAGDAGTARVGEPACVLERADRAAIYCQSLVASFVQSARAVAAGSDSSDGTASGLLDALLSEYPFADHERACVTARVERDFGLRGRRDLVFMVLCTVVNNALHALRSVPWRRLEIVAGVDEAGDAVGRGWIRVRDTGVGIPEPLLARLTIDPFTSKADEAGSGMGLVFCRRVMESLGGTITLRSSTGEGTTVLLTFDPSRAPA